jgi:hypothetical protein
VHSLRTTGACSTTNLRDARFQKDNITTSRHRVQPTKYFAHERLAIAQTVYATGTIGHCQGPGTGCPITESSKRGSGRPISPKRLPCLQLPRKRGLGMWWCPFASTGKSPYSEDPGSVYLVHPNNPIIPGIRAEALRDISPASPTSRPRCTFPPPPHCQS